MLPPLGSLVLWLVGRGLTSANRAIGVGDFDVGVGKQFELPAGLVDEMVMAVAQQHQVLQLGQPVATPVLTW